MFPGYLYCLVFGVLTISMVTDLSRRVVYDSIFAIGGVLVVVMMVASFDSFNVIGASIFASVGAGLGYVLWKYGKVGSGDAIGIFFLGWWLGLSYWRGITDYAFMDVILVGFTALIVYGLVYALRKGVTTIELKAMPLMAFIWFGFLVHYVVVIIRL